MYTIILCTCTLYCSCTLYSMQAVCIIIIIIHWDVCIHTQCWPWWWDEHSHWIPAHLDRWKWGLLLSSFVSSPLIFPSINPYDHVYTAPSLQIISTQSYRNPFDIPRGSLLSQIARMRTNFFSTATNIPNLIEEGEREREREERERERETMIISLLCFHSNKAPGSHWSDG